MNETNKLKKILLVSLSVILGALFIFSAWSKTQPNLQLFEFIIESQVHLSKQLSAVLARFFIGIEGGLGLLLFANIFGYGRWVLKVCIGLLIVFSIHLLYLLISHGNDVNCGCMGDIVPMTPVESLLKNVGLLAGLLVLLKWHKTKDGVLLDYGSFILCGIIVAVPFFIFPFTKETQMPLSKLYTTTRSEHPTVELRKGKHILCFMSLSCSHCRDAAKKIAILKKENPTLPFYFALASGTDSTRAKRFNDFLTDTKVKDIPYHFLEQKDFVDMVKAAGNMGVPVILWMQDTTAVRNVNLDELNMADLNAWLSQ
ncbi:hypothetical protein F0919_00035 [Taibaiella lutea]|uniref:Methylamine utilisation protein MauE domain-containing protein n=1 Tax=Taibaiella lutea TaxID=2608001 RepID=A0A5M6CM77_9BACT|nr:MauE/DoxX family redox-associated membrane protein [Taibaiella lutea]KAA5536097.1 hypothetical protein F0919_00035 [Taibaiella lutea]